MSKRRLGKGIDALLQGRDLEQLSRMSSILMVDVDDIEPNPNQPRRSFNPETLAELAASIREKGIIQPILAEDRGDGRFTIIAGERRYRAAKLAGLDQVPVISQEFSEEEKLEIALIENIQREDLNPIDEARAYQTAMGQAGITQEQLAERLGRSRPAVANALRLLRLEPGIQEALADGGVSAGHARALLAVEGAERAELFRRVVDEGLSVREAELLSRGEPLPSAAPAGAEDDRPGGRPRADQPGAERSAGRARPRASDARDPDLTLGDDDLLVPDTGGPKSVELQKIEESLIGRLGTRVVIRGTDAKGRIEITYVSMRDLERIVELMGARLPE